MLLDDQIEQTQRSRLWGLFIWAGMGLLSSMLLLNGCGSRKAEGTTYQVYSVNKEETSISAHAYVTEATDQTQILEELLTQLQTAAPKLDYKAPLSAPVILTDYSITEKQLLLNFEETYKKQEITTEVLVRAAIVRTLTQIPGIDFVSFVIGQEPLADQAGNIVGTMSADMFIDNAGKEINTYEKVRLHLYLANSTGDGLTEVNRSVVYNSNVSMEKLVIEQLIAGVQDNEKAYPTMNPDTKVVSVTVRDGICYVNFDESFLTQPYTVTSEVTIYSITNSLVELSNVNKVQISIDGDTDVMYREKISLATVFERNLELVKS